MIKIKYGKQADKETIMINAEKIKLNFETNSKLDITKNAKVVEAYSHNTDRMTLLYQNLGSFTFARNKQKNISEPQSWKVVYVHGDEYEEMQTFL